MYKIYIENLTFEAIIGIDKLERMKTQKVVCDVEIGYEKEENFLDYKEIGILIKSDIVDNRYYLIEDALDSVVKKLIESYSEIKSLKLKITKPEILPNCTVGASLSYSRDLV